VSSARNHAKTSLTQGLVCELLPGLDERRVVNVPSKHGERRRHEGPQSRGIHQHWIFHEEAERFIGCADLPCLAHRDGRIEAR
jgi:hypothetical protein